MKGLVCFLVSLFFAASVHADSIGFDTTEVDGSILFGESGDLTTLELTEDVSLNLGIAGELFFTLVQGNFLVLFAQAPALNAPAVTTHATTPINFDEIFRAVVDSAGGTQRVGLAIAQVPEPVSALLCGMGLSILGLCGRRPRERA